MESIISFNISDILVLETKAGMMDRRDTQLIAPEIIIRRKCEVLSKGLAILVLSCDKYCDAWDPFFRLFFHFWPDCPYPVYLGTNKLDYQDERVNVIKIGEDKSWEDGVRKMLRSIEAEYILPIYEDMFIAKAIDTAMVAEAFTFTKREDISCFRFVPRMKCRKRYANEKEIFYILPTDEYCVNAGVNIWKKVTYIELLKPGFSPWDFEVKNSEQCNIENKLPGIFATFKSPKMTILQGIIQGKWNPSSIRFCEKNGIKIDTTKRGVMTSKEVIWERTKFLGREHIPPFIRKYIKKALFKMHLGRGFVARY